MSRVVSVSNAVMGEQKKRDTVPALRRAVAILNMISDSPDLMNAADIARMTGLPKSTLHGLLGVMVELNLIVKSEDGRFSTGAHPMRWASSFLAQMDIVSIFRNHFSTKNSLSNYTVTLTILDHDEVVYIGCRNSDQPLGHTFRIGMRLPAPYTATGKILLSELSDDAITAMFSNELPTPLSAKSVKDLNHLKQELHEVRLNGYSIDDGQIREGMVCIGAGVRDFSGQLIAAIAISILKNEASADNIKKLTLLIQKAAFNLSVQIGYKGTIDA